MNVFVVNGHSYDKYKGIDEIVTEAVFDSIDKAKGYIKDTFDFMTNDDNYYWVSKIEADVTSNMPSWVKFTSFDSDIMYYIWMTEKNVQ